MDFGGDRVTVDLPLESIGEVTCGASVSLHLAKAARSLRVGGSVAFVGRDLHRARVVFELVPGADAAVRAMMDLPGTCRFHPRTDQPVRVLVQDGHGNTSELDLEAISRTGLSLTAGMEEAYMFMHSSALRLWFELPGTTAPVAISALMRNFEYGEDRVRIGLELQAERPLEFTAAQHAIERYLDLRLAELLSEVRTPPS